MIIVNLCSKCFISQSEWPPREKKLRDVKSELPICEIFSYFTKCNIHREKIDFTVWLRHNIRHNIIRALFTIHFIILKCTNIITPPSYLNDFVLLALFK